MSTTMKEINKAQKLNKKRFILATFLSIVWGVLAISTAIAYEPEPIKEDIHILKECSINE